jgi:predicted Zn-dependent protease
MDTLETKSICKPSQLISVEKGKELHKNYNEKISLLCKGENTADANAVWFSLNELENYIAYIKSEGIEKGYEVNGIRFYFGSYAATEKKGKAGHTTLFLSPTGNQIGQNETSQRTEGNESDITELSPLNYGSMGNPPKMEYGAQ